MEMEEICGVDNLQRSVEESWSKTWAPAIITQAQLEKDNNARLHKAMTSLNGDSSEYTSNVILFVVL